MLLFDDRKRKVTIKHDPKMLVPVLNANPVIRNYQSFNKSFCSLIHDDGLAIEEDLISIDVNNSEENDGVALSSIDAKTHLSKHIDATELISKD